MCLNNTMCLSTPYNDNENGNDDDGNCTPFQITATDDPTPAGAHTSVDALLNLAYDAAQPHVGPDTFTYTVTDTDGSSAVGQVVVDVPARELEAAWPLDDGAGLLELAVLIN